MTLMLNKEKHGKGCSITSAWLLLLLITNSSYFVTFTVVGYLGVFTREQHCIILYTHFNLAEKEALKNYHTDKKNIPLHL
jgi:hypothetical protein